MSADVLPYEPPRERQMTRHELVRLAAKEYIARGWFPIPLNPRTKECRDQAWMTEVYEPEDFHGDENIGLRLVGKSDARATKLVGVDFDAPEIDLEVVDALLPGTRARWGRAGKAISHALYVAPFEKPVVFTDLCALGSGQKATLVEIRVQHQSMCPPSIHPNGEALYWLEKDTKDVKAAEVEPEALLRGARLVATCALVARRYPDAGNRHYWGLALAGLLRRLGVTPDECAAVVRHAARRNEDANGGDRLSEVRSTYGEPDGGPLAGAGKLIDLMGEQGRSFVASLKKIWGQKVDARPVLTSASEFLAQASEQEEWLVPGIAPVGGLVMFHGRPRSMKSLAALSMLVSASLGKAPWGDERFAPGRAIRCAYFSEEDGRGVVAARLRWLLKGLGVEPEALSALAVECRRGLLLTDKDSQEQIRTAIEENAIELAWFDTARAMAPGVDQGPAEGASAVKFLRHLLAETALRSIGLTHHDVKPARDGADVRARAERSSGGALLPAVDCPIGFERQSERATLAVPDRYKVGADPHSFRLEFRSATDEGESFKEFVVVEAVQSDENAEKASRIRKAILDVLRKAKDENGQHEWLNTKAIKDVVRGDVNVVSAELPRMVNARLIEVRAAKQNAKEYRLVTQQSMGLL